MAALIGALDSYTSTQIGENGHTEYTWSVFLPVCFECLGGHAKQNKTSLYTSVAVFGLRLNIVI